MIQLRFLLSATLLWSLCFSASAYSPKAQHQVKTTYLDLQDTNRNRTIPIKLFSPEEAEGKLPIVIWSHGLGGSRDGADYIGEHLASHGYLAVHVQHPGSDSSLLREGLRQGGIMETFQKNASAQNYFLRIQDIHFLIDELERMNEAADGPLSGRLDLERIGMSGHSFGARTSQAVVGQQFMLPRGPRDMRDERIKAAVLMSPSPANDRQDPAENFGAISIPVLHLTGTEDTSPIEDLEAIQRRVPFDHIPASDQYLLIFDGGAHSVFSGRAGLRNESYHAVIEQLCLAFWDAYLRNSDQARKWLQSDPSQVRSILKEDDVWEHK